MIQGCCFFLHDCMNISTSLSHSPLSIILGMNRVTVSKVITALCKTGELRVLNQKIQINHKLL